MKRLKEDCMSPWYAERMADYRFNGCAFQKSSLDYTSKMPLSIPDSSRQKSRALEKADTTRPQESPPYDRYAETKRAVKTGNRYKIVDESGNRSHRITLNLFGVLFIYRVTRTSYWRHTSPCLCVFPPQ